MIPAKLQAAWTAAIAKAENTPVLTDFETGEPVGRIGDKGERYGPVFVPFHDYKILYAECAK